MTELISSQCHCYSVAKSCLTLCNPMNWSTQGFPVLHYLPEFVQTHVHRVGDAIQPSHPLSPHSPAFNLSQHQSLFQWVGSWLRVAKVLELQLQLPECFSIQDWFLLGLIGLISLQFRGLTKVITQELASSSLLWCLIGPVSVLGSSNSFSYKA